jgi:hypothetical protein
MYAQNAWKKISHVPWVLVLPLLPRHCLQTLVIQRLHEWKLFMNDLQMPICNEVSCPSKTYSIVSHLTTWMIVSLGELLKSQLNRHAF